ncbi:MAG: GIY-YIG nuclease family protein, partial [Pseudomonadales bacterium]
MQKDFYIDILASKRKGTLYIGVTSNLIKRILENKNNHAEGFTQKYKVHDLVCYEKHFSAESAM